MANRFHYTGGALICDEPIADVTQTLDDEAAKYYGGRFFVGESMTIGAARRIAELLDGELVAREEVVHG